jgi:hypothetical protein
MARSNALYARIEEPGTVTSRFAVPALEETHGRRALLGRRT